MALDLGGVVGVCALKRGHAPTFDVWVLNGAHRGARCANLSDRIIAFVKEHGPFEIGCYEAPLPAGARGVSAVQSMFGYSSHAESAFTRLSMRYMSEHMGTVRKHVTGRGTYPADTSKSEILKHVREVMGFEHVVDDNMADAIIAAEYWANVADMSLLDYQR